MLVRTVLFAAVTLFIRTNAFTNTFPHRTQCSLVSQRSINFVQSAIVTDERAESKETSVRSDAWSGFKKRGASLVNALKNNTFFQPAFEVLETASNNSKKGTPGQRGEFLFLMQMAVLALVLGGDSLLRFVPYHYWIGDTVAASAFLTGISLIISAVIVNKQGISFFSAPVSDEIKMTGPYEFLRHPIYGGLLLSAVGYSMILHSADRLLLCAVLAYILDMRSNLEDNLLIEKHGVVFEEYTKRTTKLVPFLY